MALFTVTLSLAVAFAAPPLTPAEAVYGELKLSTPVDPKPLPKEFHPDGVSLEEVRKNPKRYPVRAAVLEAIEVLEQSRGTIPLRTEIRRVDLGKPQVMKEIFKQQEGPAIAIAMLDDVQKSLLSLEAVRHREPSRRWQAHFDFVLAEVEFHLALNHEYNDMLAHARSENLPELQPARGEVGWRLVPTETMKSRGPIREIASSARERFERLAIAEPDTPWGIQAARFQNAPPGRQWLPMTDLVDP